MSLNWQNLKNNRDEILKAEIGSLLFNLGKTHIGFWKEKNGEVYFEIDENNFKSKYEFELFTSYKKYYENNHFENELKNINQSLNLKDFIFNTNISINGENKKWAEYFKGDVSSSDIVKKVFFEGCENINSGIDKGSPKEQLKGKLWISNAFGSFKEEVIKDNFDDKRRIFFEKLHRFLDENNYYDNPNWEHIREFVIKELKNWYSHLLSDSRFPVNDVTLYDQAYMSATMFKASIAGIFLNTTQSQNYISNPQSIKWQILGVQYDKLSLAEKGLKPAHIIWYREKSKELDDVIKNIVESDYAFGNEIYRDESGIYFLVPDGINLNDEIKNKILEAFKENFNDEVYPYIGFTKPSRGTMNLTSLLKKAKENFLKADNSLKSQLQNVDGAIGICQVCQNRLVKEKEKDDETLMCDTCRNRKKGRVNKWLDHQAGETIWIDELADSNNRVALVSLKFELMEWLNGGLLSSLLVQKLNYEEFFLKLKQLLIDIKDKTIVEKLKSILLPYFDEILNINDLSVIVENLKKNSSLTGRKKGKYISIFNNLNNSNDIKTVNEEIEELKNKLIGYSDKDLFEFLDFIKKEVFKSIILNKQTNFINNLKNQGSLLKTLENNIDDIKKDLIDTGIVNNNIFENLKQILQQLKNIEKIFKVDGKEIIFFNTFVKENIIIFKLSDSMHKWFNIYNNFDDYIQQIFFGSIVGTNFEKEIKDSLLNSKIDWQDEKIKWNELKEQDIDLLSKLLLQFLLRKNPSPARLRRVWESTQEFFYDVKEKILDSFTAIRTKSSFEQKVPDFAYLVNDEKFKNKQSYKQYFSIIDPTPISWQFIMPTNKVEEFIKKVQKLYYKNFKYVNGKLPLHIGVVVQKSKDPLYVGIKALRNMRRDIKEWSEIKKEGKGLLPDLECYEEIVEQNNYAKDFYSLYETDNADYDFMLLPSDKGVKKYNPTDKFVVYPNTIDFEFLDTNSRRNEIYYKNGKRVALLKQNRPYTWEEFEKFEEFKKIFSNKTALLHRLVSLIYSKLQDWEDNKEDNKESFKVFMKSTFKRIKKQDGVDVSKIFDIENFDFDEAKKFIDMFEFWHTTLKEI